MLDSTSNKKKLKPYSKGVVQPILKLSSIAKHAQPEIEKGSIGSRL